MSEYPEEVTKTCCTISDALRNMTETGQFRVYCHGEISSRKAAAFFIHPTDRHSGHTAKDELMRIPLKEADIQKLKELSKPSEMAIMNIEGGETVVDREKRRSYTVPAECYSMPKKWKEFAYPELLSQIQSRFAIHGGVIARFYKMIIYEPGDFFVEHVDSSNSVEEFGTMVVNIPTESGYTGGGLQLKLKQVTTQVLDTSGQKFFCWYKHIPHQVLPVTSGHRVVLTYDLLRISKPDPSIDLMCNPSTALARLFRKLDTCLDEKIPLRIFIQLEHFYGEAQFLNWDPGSMKDSKHPFLKGRDQVVFQSLLQLGRAIKFQELDQSVTFKDWDMAKLPKRPVHGSAYRFDQKGTWQGEGYEKTFHPKIARSIFFGFSKHGWDLSSRNLRTTEEYNYNSENYGNSACEITFVYRHWVMMVELQPRIIRRAWQKVSCALLAIHQEQPNDLKELAAANYDVINIILALMWQLLK